jgi:pimeloyl-ACP methyl ester carboxylesterase
MPDPGAVGQAGAMGSYVDVSGLNTYYEKQGKGDALLLLHGGLVGADSWNAQIPALAEQFQVFATERRGHGHTPDVEGRLTYLMMAQDTIDFMDAIGLTSAHLVGWSDGALVAAHVALQRPDLVEKLVLIGQFLNPEGMTPAVKTLFDDPQVLRDGVRPEYEAVSPDGAAHFDIFFDKVIRMWREDQGIPLPDLAAITSPTLLLQGDDDAVSVTHNAAVAAILPESQLAVIPGASHLVPIEKPALVNSILLEFLGSEHVAKLM